MAGTELPAPTAPRSVTSSPGATVQAIVNAVVAKNDLEVDAGSRIMTAILDSQKATLDHTRI